MVEREAVEGSAALSLIQKFTVDGQSCVRSYVSSAPREMVLLENELHHKGFSMTIDILRS